MARLLYTLISYLLLPLILLRLLKKGRRQPEYRENLKERFGWYGEGTEAPVTWIHAVSVGETRAAQPLVRALLERDPEARILITHMTPTGRATSRQLFGDKVRSVYLPYDYPFAVAGFLDCFRPSLGIIMETELWPNLVAICRERHIPLMLANARLSERSAARYARFPALTRQMLSSLSAVLAQTQGDASRLETLGARNLQVAGNIKFDVLPPPEMQAIGVRLRDLIGPRKVLLAASTREGEEAGILEALSRTPLDEALLLIVPRHPERFGLVEALARERGFRVQRRSPGKPVATETQVLVGDTMGEMFAYYGACDLAFIGGSLQPLGGQNLIEACAVGKPVLVGPHTFNFLEATEEAIASGAALRVEDSDHLIAVARSLLVDTARCQKMGEAGLRFTARHRGATARTLAAIAQLV